VTCGIVRTGQERIQGFSTEQVPTPFSSLAEHSLRSLPQDVAQSVFAPGEWHNARVGRRKLHGGVLLGLVGPLGKTELEFLPKYAAFSFGYPQLLAITRAGARIEKWATVMEPKSTKLLFRRLVNRRVMLPLALIILGLGILNVIVIHNLKSKYDVFHEEKVRHIDMNMSERDVGIFLGHPGKKVVDAHVNGEDFVSRQWKGIWVDLSITFRDGRMEAIRVDPHGRRPSSIEKVFLWLGQWLVV